MGHQAHTAMQAATEMIVIVDNESMNDAVKRSKWNRGGTKASTIPATAR